MSIQFKRGTTAQHAAYVGAIGEVTVDTDKDALVVHDGVTAGGSPQATSAGIQGQAYTAFASTGAAPAFTLTPLPAIDAYTTGQRFHVAFSAAGTTGSNTLNISGLGVKNLKQYDAAGTKVAGVVAAGQRVDVEYDGVDMVILDPLPPSGGGKIQEIAATAAANNLTLGLAPTSLDFRSSALNSGTVNTRTVGSALSLVAPSGATLGTVAAIAARLALLAIDNAGTVELAVVNLAGGNNLDETTLISTTAISAAADANNVIYSTTARANVPFRVVGFIDITEAAAGTWATVPSTIQGMGGQALAALSSLGYGQTWQIVSRAIGTTYYNTTGKPITAKPWMHNAAAYNVGCTINGLAILGVGAGAGTTSSDTFIIPVSASYIFTGGTSMTGCYELR